MTLTLQDAALLMQQDELDAGYKVSTTASPAQSLDVLAEVAARILWDRPSDLCGLKS